jgi:hypothetical protein
MDEMIGPQPICRTLSSVASASLRHVGRCQVGVFVHADAQGIEHMVIPAVATCASWASTAAIGSSASGAARSGLKVIGVEFDEPGMMKSPAMSSPLRPAPGSMPIKPSRSTGEPSTISSARTMQALFRTVRQSFQAVLDCSGVFWPSTSA